MLFVRTTLLLCRLNDLLHNKIADSNSGLSCAIEEKALVMQSTLSGEGTEESCNGHCRSALQRQTQTGLREGGGSETMYDSAVREKCVKTRFTLKTKLFTHLNVIIESGQLIFILGQQTKRILFAKILKLK